MKRFLFCKAVILFIFVSAAEAIDFSPELTDIGMRLYGDVVTATAGADVKEHNVAGGGGAGIFFNFDFPEIAAIETGVNIFYDYRRFTAETSGAFDGSRTGISFFTLAVPVLVKMPLFSDDSENDFDLSALTGIELSCLLGRQVYQDNWGVSFDMFLRPILNVSFVLGMEYETAVGAGKLSLGLRCAINLFEHWYHNNGNSVYTGYLLKFSPTVGYALPISSFRAE